MADPLLAVNGLSVRYRKNGDSVTAVKGVSFILRTGSTLAIIGESGAGKSSIALALAGLHDPDVVSVGGTVMLADHEITSMKEEGLDRLRGSRIGMVFQDPRGALDPVMKVVDQVAEAIRINLGAGRGEARALATERLHGVGLGADVLERSPYPHQLSSGLCQRAMIAIALAAKPSLLIADEPTGSLDLTRQAQIVRLLREQSQAASLGLVFITHDISLAMVVADDMLVMHEGRQVEYGSAESVISRPSHPYTVELLRAWRSGFLSQEKTR